jgi:predicted dithiol-disulfide oxidoreductase (DUF899 family)
MPKIRVDGKVHNHKVVSEPRWLVARKALLAKEKQYTRLGDRLNRERRRLPWVRVDKSYSFEGPNGKESLSALFGRRSQLIVYHFMFPPEWTDGCPHCSFWADHYDGALPHLNQRDTTLVAISRAPLAKIKRFQARMGWKFKWVSSAGGAFNYDFHASFTPEANRKGTAFFNYEHSDAGFTDREGLSVFYKDGRGAIYHTYSTYARGIDILNGTYHFLDLVPKGRDEGNRGQYWVRYHDKYK